MTAPERTRIEVRIGRRGFLGVEAVAGEEDLSGPLFAVNLLDRRRPWAYELYPAYLTPFLLRPRMHPPARRFSRRRRLRRAVGTS